MSILEIMVILAVLACFYLSFIILLIANPMWWGTRLVKIIPREKRYLFKWGVSDSKTSKEGVDFLLALLMLLFCIILLLPR